ncbi:hypothetical protein DES36_11546 [Alkalibaculum bacchi]|uniref:Uncharacterized protein n=1 Tax=Alkalibaculum bacchi TaxID=645887 RepID=A0A366I1H9_9FIRM|nr:hypothetical protein [Alkalibaculum bacchi]RBP61047.1 hypothetical protein DES36_11546 [Alkalibaculum bacchi]
MDIALEMIALSTELASIVGKKSVEAIFDKIRTVKKKGNSDEIIGNLEEIISELISDKNQLIHISQAYEEHIISQKISDDEINYITTSIIPILENLLAQSEGQDTIKMQQGLDLIKQIVSKETFNIMQILGFDFKHAVGAPLTELVASLITSKISNSNVRALDLQVLEQQREIEYLKICQDKEAYQRLLEVFNK